MKQLKHCMTQVCLMAGLVFGGVLVQSQLAGAAFETVQQLVEGKIIPWCDWAERASDEQIEQNKEACFWDATVIRAESMSLQNSPQSDPDGSYSPFLGAIAEAAHELEKYIQQCDGRPISAEVQNAAKALREAIAQRPEFAVQSKCTIDVWQDWASPAVSVNITIPMKTGGGNDQTLILCSIGDHNWPDREAFLEKMYLLFSNEFVMARNAGGTPSPRGEVWEKTKKFGFDRWAEGDFRGAFAVCLKENGEETIIGNAFLRQGIKPGQGDTGLALFPEFWNKGFANAITRAMLEHYVPELRKRNISFDGKPLEEITIVTTEDHGAVIRMAIAYGFGPADPDVEVLTDDAAIAERQKAIREAYRRDSREGHFPRFYNILDKQGNVRSMGYVTHRDAFKLWFIKRLEPAK